MGIPTQDNSQPRPSSLIPKEQRLISTITDFPSTHSHGTRPPLCYTSKFIEMGGRAHFFLSLVGRSSISALICDSFMPAMRLILGTQG